MKKILTKSIQAFLRKQRFLYIGTSNLENKPHASAKPLLKIKGNLIYLVDYVIGETHDNIQQNHYVSLAAIDVHKVVGYQFFGEAQILDKGNEYEELCREVHEKQVDLATEQLISRVRKDKKSRGYGIISLEAAHIIKVIIKEMTQIKSTGKIEKTTVEEESREY